MNSMSLFVSWSTKTWKHSVSKMSLVGIKKQSINHTVIALLAFYL